MLEQRNLEFGFFQPLNDLNVAAPRFDAFWVKLMSVMAQDRAHQTQRKPRGTCRSEPVQCAN